MYMFLKLLGKRNSICSRYTVLENAVLNRIVASLWDPLHTLVWRVKKTFLVIMGTL